MKKQSCEQKIWRMFSVLVFLSFSYFCCQVTAETDPSLLVANSEEVIENIGSAEHLKTQSTNSENCTSLKGEKLDIDFSSSVVVNEYIVGFHGYHSASARSRYLSAALRLLPAGSWRVLPRTNLAALYPSDFDVLRVRNLSDSSRAALLRHPCVKHVTSQRRLTRALKFTAELNSTDYMVPRLSQRRNLFWKHLLTGEVKAKEELADAGEEFPRPSGDRSHFGPGGAAGSRRLLRSVPQQITSELKAEHLWNLGYRGAGVRVAIFDTGLNDKHPHFKRGRIKDRTNWTNENKLTDGLGHGTFVAGVIASDRDCRGFAPEADLYIFRVFTDGQVSYTSWFLDAFNYAIIKRVHVLNLSIGGPDFMDQPFVDKVWELTANGVVLVSAIGNDGPLYGTLNNPADQMDVIGVGGINFDDEIAKFSSRGMTTWELPAGYGRVKPDLVTYGDRVRGSNMNGGCRSLSGTSVASPVVAGAVTLLMSAVLQERDALTLNPASVKQALLASAVRLPQPNLFEQGHGKMDLIGAYRALRSYTPQLSLSPSYIDLTERPYMWPYHTQPLYYGSMPVVVNVTILNGHGVLGHITSPPLWQPFLPDHSQYLEVSFTYSRHLWPWSGYLAVSLTAAKAAANWEGVAHGQVLLAVETDGIVSSVAFPVRAEIVPRPSRTRRLLWDQFHNLRYPPGYFPRDNLRMKNDPLDWNADHVHTNFRQLYADLVDAGYFVEVLGAPLTCFNATDYGTLLLVDSEDEYFPAEVRKLERDVRDHGLNVLVVGDWYNTSVMRQLKFYEENTRQWLLPDTGGSNVPALNQLLAPFGVALGDTVLDGDFHLAGQTVTFSSGTSLAHFPLRGLVAAPLLRDQGSEVLQSGSPTLRAPVLGLLPEAGRGQGRLAVYGDSNCLDSAHMTRDCFWLLRAMLDFCRLGEVSAPLMSELEPWRQRWAINDSALPQRSPTSQLSRFSHVLQSGVLRGVRHLPACPVRHLVSPQPLNKSAPVNFESSRKLRAIAQLAPEPPRRRATVEPLQPETLRQELGGPELMTAVAALGTLAVLVYLVYFRCRRRPGRRSARALKRLPVGHSSLLSLLL